MMAFYRLLLLVAALIAASSAIPLNDEILPEDNEFISVDNSLRDQTTTAGQSAQQVAGNEAETDEPMSQGEVPLDDEDLDHGATIDREAVVEETQEASSGEAIPDELVDTGYWMSIWPDCQHKVLDPHIKYEPHPWRCGPFFVGSDGRGAACPSRFGPQYCNEASGICYFTKEYAQAQASTTYDSCGSTGCSIHPLPIRSDGRCGPLFGHAACGIPSAPYCNEANGYCGFLRAHADAQASTKYDICGSKPFEAWSNQDNNMDGKNNAAYAGGRRRSAHERAAKVRRRSMWGER